METAVWLTGSMLHEDLLRRAERKDEDERVHVRSGATHKQKTSTSIEGRRSHPAEELSVKKRSEIKTAAPSRGEGGE
jgi:hypothetical protein